MADCLRQAAGRLPAGLDADQLALFVLTLMEGAVMLARAYRSIEPYDTAVTQLRDYFDRLLSDGTNWSAPRSGALATRQKKRRRRNVRVQAR